MFQPHAERGDLGQQRAYLGTTKAGASTLTLRDAQGRVRVRLVAADGKPRIEMLDGSGRVVRALEATQWGWKLALVRMFSALMLTTQVDARSRQEQ